MTNLAFDVVIHHWAVTHRAELVARIARALTDTGSGIPAYVLAMLAGAFAYRWRGAFAFTAALVAVEGLRYGLMSWIARPRPPASDWVYGVSGYSLPSGHATTSAFVAVLLVIAMRERGMSRGWYAVPIAWAVAVGLTRVYLGVHWPTDVLGGWLLVTIVCTVGTVVLRRARVAEQVS
jgi:undecaprenyl-diphosphatase